MRMQRLRKMNHKLAEILMLPLNHKMEAVNSRVCDWFRLALKWEGLPLHLGRSRRPAAETKHTHTHTYTHTYIYILYLTKQILQTIQLTVYHDVLFWWQWDDAPSWHNRGAVINKPGLEQVGPAACCNSGFPCPCRYRRYIHARRRSC